MTERQLATTNKSSYRRCLTALSAMLSLLAQPSMIRTTLTAAVVCHVDLSRRRSCSWAGKIG